MDEDEKAYFEGWTDGYDDRLSDNPYEEGTQEHADYERGYHDGVWDS
jgi:hypothetical protein